MIIQSFLNHPSVYIVLSDMVEPGNLPGYAIRCNKAFADFCNKRPDDLTLSKDNLLKMFHPDDIALIRGIYSDFNACNLTQQTVTIRMRQGAKNGYRLYLDHIVLQENIDGKPQIVHMMIAAPLGLTVQKHEAELLCNRLSKQEKTVSHYIKQGKTSREISSIMDISFETVKSHRRNIKRKLGLPKSVNLLKFIIENL